MVAVQPVSSKSSCPMASDKAKPKTRQKKKAPAAEEGEPTKEVLGAAPRSALSIGDAVHHPMFGDGEVKRIEDNKLTIAFEENVTKVIREDFVTRKR